MRNIHEYFPHYYRNYTTGWDELIIIGVLLLHASCHVPQRSHCTIPQLVLLTQPSTPPPTSLNTVAEFSSLYIFLFFGWDSYRSERETEV
jgi:hypothetical protein